MFKCLAHDRDIIALRRRAIKEKKKERRFFASLIFVILLLSRLREKTHITGILHCASKFMLILGRSSSRTARGDLSVRINKPEKKFSILVVNVFNVVLLEVADLFPRSHFFEHICSKSFLLRL